VRALEFLGGVPRQVVPDNLRGGVLRANWYEPGLNPTYCDLAAHYGTAILPARVRRPRDKAKVEAGVLVVERWILARLRHQRFASLAALNAAISALLTDLNIRPMRRLGVSRRQLFEELDRPALASLPAEPFVYAEWRIRRVGLDYHVDVEGHYYSVPHRLLRQQVEAVASVSIRDRSIACWKAKSKVLQRLTRWQLRALQHRADAQLLTPGTLRIEQAGEQQVGGHLCANRLSEQRLQRLGHVAAA
jgi:transposase